MNTEKMSHVVSMTANVGVLIGLSLLVYELNQNNQHLQEQAAFNAAQMRMDQHKEIATNPAVSGFIHSHVSDQSQVTDLRRLQWFVGQFVQWQWEFERERAGLIKQFDSPEHMAAAWREALHRWDGDGAWQQRKHQFNAEFVEFMDTQVIGPG